MVDIDSRQREMLRLIWREGRMSRWTLHQEMGVNPNAVGMDVAQLIEKGIVRECPSEPQGPGRPRIPLEIDPAVRHMVGLSINPGRIEAARLSLRGQLIGKPIAASVSEPAKIVPAARALLFEALNERTLAIGVSVTGLVDPDTRQILFSSSLAGQGSASLALLYDAADDRPVILENNIHALAAKWLLTHQAESNEDVLLVDVRDGQLGAALLIDGRPNRGCAIGANELGHTRFFVDTEVCYCGHPGCLERIWSTAFLRRQGVESGTLLEHIARFGTGGEAATAAIELMLDYLSAGLSNAVNFVRPNRLVLVSELTRYPTVCDLLLRSIRARLLTELVQRVRIDQWDQGDSHSAETAGWLALASLYREGWLYPAPA